MGRGGPELRVDAQLIAALPKREARWRRAASAHGGFQGGAKGGRCFRFHGFLMFFLLMNHGVKHSEWLIMVVDADRRLVGDGCNIMGGSNGRSW